MTDAIASAQSKEVLSTPPSRKMAIPKESFPGERRVALAPANVQAMQKLGFDVYVECGAGLASGFSDDDYAKAGAKITANAKDLFSSSDVVLKVRAPSQAEVETLRPGTFLASLVQPAQNQELLSQLSQGKISTLALDMIPRSTKAQKMDVLSSMGNLAGYRAVIEAAAAFSRPFTGQITAAGKMPPAKILVIGAGVAGLAAIGAGRGLGAIVRAFDTRPEVKEQISSADYGRYGQVYAPR